MHIRRRSLPDSHCLPRRWPEPVRRVLLGRGIVDPQQIDYRLKHLLPPEGLSGVDAAAERVCRAICEQERICIVGDFDADGATGVAVAVRALRAMGASRVCYRVPDRFAFGYGLSVALVDSISEPLPDLLITVDSGIACVEGVARAHERGMETIVTDHHLPGSQLPPAVAIVNPQLSDNAFPSRALAGVGVVFYLLARVRQKLLERGWFARGRAPQLSPLLDLVALGTAADMVPLDENNRRLIAAGLVQLRHRRGAAGIRALLEVAGKRAGVAHASDLCFAVAPRLNAAGRLQDMRLGIECLLSDDDTMSLELAVQLDEVNRERKRLQQEMQADADDYIAELECPEAVTHCLFDSSWHQGVVGLIAGRIKDRCHRPVVALAPANPGESELKGSVRSIPGFHARDALAEVARRASQLQMRFGGHAMAAGLSIDQAQLDTFARVWQDVASDLIEPGVLEGSVYIDGALDTKEIGPRLGRWLQRVGPYGKDFPEPVFEGEFAVTGKRLLRGGHLELEVDVGGRSLRALRFHPSPAEVEEISPAGRCAMLYRLEASSFRGRQQASLLVERFL